MDYIRMNCPMAEFFKKAKNGHGRMKSFGFLILPCRKWLSQQNLKNKACPIQLWIKYC